MAAAAPGPGCVRAGKEGSSSLPGLHKGDSIESESSHALWKHTVDGAVFRGPDQESDGGPTVETSPQLPPLALVVANEVAVLAGVDVAVNGDEEPLVELESAGELLSELPRALQHLVDDGRYLFGVPGQVVASAQEARAVSSRRLRCPPPPSQR